MRSELETTLTWGDVSRLCDDLGDRIMARCTNLGISPAIWGIPRGGSVVASFLCANGFNVVSKLEDANFIVDDLVDSGRTANRALESASAPPFSGLNKDCVFDALVRKSHSPQNLAVSASVCEAWVHFPWEVQSSGSFESAEDNVVRLIEMVGEDPTREGLLETPQRVVRSFREMTSGYNEDPDSYFKVFNEDGADEMIVLQGVGFNSLCEHHLLPFWGKVAVGYVPNSGRVIGLSKLARITHTFAKRFQNQERLTQQIARYLADHKILKPLGAGAVIKAHHTCMSCRGVREQNSKMITSATFGIIRDEDSARSEFLSLALCDL